MLDVIIRIAEAVIDELKKNKQSNYLLTGAVITVIQQI